MLRRADILKVIVQCLFRNINYTKLGLQICSHYNINDALKNYTAMKN